MGFREWPESTAAHRRVQYGDFVRSRGVNDFLMDSAGKQEDPRDLAARALRDLTVGDKGSMDGVVCGAVVGFLEDAVGVPPTDRNGERRLKDLRDLISNSTPLREYRSWVETWYP